MPTTVSANEAKTRLDALLGDVDDRGDEVIVERHGRPTAVLMSYAAYEEVRALREREQRRQAEAVARLLALEERVAAQNQDITEEEAIALADQLSHEMIDDMAARGEITFERDLR